MRWASSRTRAVVGETRSVKFVVWRRAVAVDEAEDLGCDQRNKQGYLQIHIQTPAGEFRRPGHL